MICLGAKKCVLNSMPALKLLRSHTASTAGCRFFATKRGVTSASDGKQETVIRIPRQMQARIDNVKQIKGKRLEKVSTTKAGKLLIVSKHSKLNQPASYTLGKFDRPLLASEGWKHNKSFGDFFTINSTQKDLPFVTVAGGKEAEEKGVEKAVTFKSLGLCQELTEALQAMGIVYPTTVQLQTIPKLLKGKNVLCAAETGSGKTLCYLLPLIHKLSLNRYERESNSQAPQSVVLVPSRELADQVKAVAKSLGTPLGLAVRNVGGGRGIGNVKLAFSGGAPDILIATPGALWKALRRNYVDLSDLSCFVMDEADTLFDESFAELVESILLQTQVASDPSETIGLGRKAQLVVIGATFPGGVGELLKQVTDLGSIVTVKSKRLHHLMPHVKQAFLKVRGADKLVELLQIIRTPAAADRDGAGVLVFCNSASTVNWLGYLLDDHGVKHARLQGQMPAVMRAGIFNTFQKGLVDVLVCTDIASRGLDTQRVKMVINYDFPPSHTDYLHRAGRVGRMGSKSPGSVVSFVTHPWDVELVQKIETAARRRASLPGMESAIHQPSPKAHLTQFDSDVKTE
ncbi:putative ATP-dependent RNA helicase DDX28 [Huso huso]|uniref:RNA helicase n=1 Tax=Huso huso TaxID=61971 RepID=A0ABR0Z5Q8_HUSHU